MDISVKHKHDIPESIEELRNICQKGLDGKQNGKITNPRDHIYRRVSIYFTKILLRLGATANQVTITRLFIIVISGILLTLGRYEYLVLAGFLYILSYVLDYSDGEIARYNHSESVVGDHLDSLTHLFTYPYLFACISFLAYKVLENPIVFAFGFSASLSFLWNLDSLATKMNELKGYNSIEKETPGDSTSLNRVFAFSMSMITKYGANEILFCLGIAFNQLHLILFLYGTGLPLFWMVHLYQTIK